MEAHFTSARDVEGRYKRQRQMKSPSWLEHCKMWDDAVRKKIRRIGEN